MSKSQKQLLQKKDHPLLVFTGGGTAGHVYPALAIIEELQKERPLLKILWIGQKGGPEEHWIQERGLSFKGIAAGKFRRYFSFRNVLDIFCIIRGFFQAFFILWHQKPHLLFSKGGFVSVPPVLAAYLLKIPIISHESDLHPGLATRINQRFSRKIFLSFEESRHFFPKKAAKDLIWTGNPVRKAIRDAQVDEAKLKMHFKDLSFPFVLVLGGSQGSAEINQLIEKIRPQLAEAGIPMVHQTGSQTQDAPFYWARPFFRDDLLPTLLASTQLLITRSGAGALAEIATLRIPSLLIPLRLGSRGDQVTNAEYFEKHHCASVLKEGSQRESDLFEKISQKLFNQQEQTHQRQNLAKLWPSDGIQKALKTLFEFL